MELEKKIEGIMQVESKNFNKFPINLSMKFVKVWEKLNIDLRAICLTIADENINNFIIEILPLVKFCDERIERFDTVRKKKFRYMKNDRNDESEVSGCMEFRVENTTNELNLFNFIKLVNLKKTSELRHIFNFQERSLLFLNLKSFSLIEILKLIDEDLNQNFLSSLEKGSKRFFVMETEYGDYFKALLKANLVAMKGEEVKSFDLVKSFYRSVLEIFRNNIFFTLTKVIKMIKSYHLNWNDCPRLLTDSSAFRLYIIKNLIKLNESKIGEKEDEVIKEAFAELKNRLRFSYYR